MTRQPWIIGAVIGVHAVVAASIFTGCQSIYTKRESAPDPGAGRPLPSVEETVTPRPVPITPAVQSPRPAPARPQVEPFAGATTTYTVVKGDTISGIAARYSLNPRDVVALNKLSNPDKVRVGQKLKLPGNIDLEAAPARKKRPASASPPVDGDLYEVKQGDTLSELALKFKVKVDDLRRANDLSGDLIRVGQKLTIPSEATPGAARPVSGSEPRPRNPVREEEPPVPEIPVFESREPPALEPVAPETGENPGEPMSLDNQGRKVREVVVEEGEDLVALSMKWNVSPVKIKQYNNLDSGQIVPGQKILIPEAAVLPGE